MDVVSGAWARLKAGETRIKIKTIGAMFELEGSDVQPEGVYLEDLVSAVEVVRSQALDQKDEIIPTFQERLWHWH